MGDRLLVLDSHAHRVSRGVRLLSSLCRPPVRYNRNSIFPLRPSLRGCEFHVKLRSIKNGLSLVKDVFNRRPMSDSMPSLQTVSSESHYDYGSEDLIRFRFCSLLAQIEIASCFRNDVELLFLLVSRILADAPRNP